MAWVTSGGTIVSGEISGLDAYKVVVSKGSYFEKRTNPSNQDETQARPHDVVTTEFRGLDYTHAETLVGSYQTSSKTITRTMQAIGGGGYTVTQESDLITDVWSTIEA